MIQSRDSGALVISLVSFDTLLFIFYLFIYLFFNQEYISGRWGKLSFPAQYESWSVPNNINGGDMHDFSGFDV